MLEYVLLPQCKEEIWRKRLNRSNRSPFISKLHRSLFNEKKIWWSIKNHFQFHELIFSNKASKDVSIFRCKKISWREQNMQKRYTHINLYWVSFTKHLLSNQKVFHDSFLLIFLSRGWMNVLSFFSQKQQTRNLCYYFCHFVRGWSEGKFSTPHTCCAMKKNPEKECWMKPREHPFRRRIKKEGNIRGGEVINKNTIFQYP